MHAASYNQDMRRLEEMENKRIDNIFKILKDLYPTASTVLNYGNPFQLFVATVLSAQTTDAQVNRITRKLFKRAGTPGQMAQMQPEELVPYLKSCGLFRQKSRYLVEAGRLIMEKYDGLLPDNYEDLVSLPGAGRKTANVVLNNAFGKPALAVDTHVFRVSRRLGLASGKTTGEVESELVSILPPDQWGPAHHRLIAHGRKICKARRPDCPECPLASCCPAFV